MPVGLEKLSESFAKLADEVEKEAGLQSDDPAAQQARVAGIARKLDALEPELRRISIEAGETVPDTSEKVKRLQRSFQALKEENDKLYIQILADVAQKRKTQEAKQNAPPAQQLPSGEPIAESAEATPVSPGGAETGVPKAAADSKAGKSESAAGASRPTMSESAEPSLRHPHTPAQGATVGEQNARTRVSGKTPVAQQGTGTLEALAASLKRLHALDEQWQQEAGRSVAVTGDSVGLPDGLQLTLTGGGPELFRILKAADSAGRTVVVDFSASWCGPCRAMKPVLSQLAAEYQGRVSVVIVDCEETPENRALAAEAEIRAFPTFHLYHGLDKKQTFQGGKPPAAFKQLLEQHLSAFPSKPVLDREGLHNLAGALKVLQASVEVPAFVESCQLLTKIITNIRDSPGEQKFQRLKAGNKRLREVLLSRPGGVRALIACNFRVIMEAGEQVFVWSRAAPQVVHFFLQLLDEAIQHPAAVAEFEPLPGHPASGEAVSAVAGGAHEAHTERGDGDADLRRQAAVLLASQLAQMLTQQQGSESPPGGQ